MFELRRYERVGFFCRLELTAMPDGEPMPARSLDLSLGGVGAVTQAAFSVGQFVTVTFFLNDSAQGEIRDKVVGRIARLAADSDANQVGVQFLNPLTEAEHGRLVDRLMCV